MGSGIPTRKGVLFCRHWECYFALFELKLCVYVVISLDYWGVQAQYSHLMEELAPSPRLNQIYRSTTDL